MDWPYEVAERDHEIQNPISDEKILLLGSYVRLAGESRVLDVACGKGGPATILATAYGCRITGIEIRPGFADAARERVAAAGLSELVEIRTGDAAGSELEPDSLDVALCLGAAFVWGSIADAAEALRPAVRPGGFVAIGEPFWRNRTLPNGVDPEDYVTLCETVARFEGKGFSLTGLIAASEDDWDRYESLHWRAMEEWLAERADGELRARHEQRRADYLRSQRSLLGWAIFVGRKA